MEPIRRNTSKLQLASERKERILQIIYLPEALLPKRNLFCSFMLSHFGSNYFWSLLPLLYLCKRYCSHNRDFVERNSIQAFVVTTLTPSQVTGSIRSRILTNQIIFLTWERLGYILVIFLSVRCNNDYCHFVTAS